LDTDDVAVVEDPAVDELPEVELPDDEEEFASPPTALATATAQAS